MDSVRNGSIGNRTERFNIDSLMVLEECRLIKKRLLYERIYQL